jgi:hypothetical protein
MFLYFITVGISKAIRRSSSSLPISFKRNIYSIFILKPKKSCVLLDFIPFLKTEAIVDLPFITLQITAKASKPYSSSKGILYPKFYIKQTISLSEVN